MISAPKRGLRRRLEHERAAGGDRRRDLVRDQVEREVERGDEAAGADRHALGHAAVAAGARRQLQFQHLATDAGGLAGGDAEGVDQARDFAARIADRLAGLDAQGQREFLAARFEARHAMFQHVAAGIRRERGHRLARGVGGGDGASIAAASAKATRATRFAAELVEHVQVGVRLHGRLAR
jgi:hypothetical protein